MNFEFWLASSTQQNVILSVIMLSVILLSVILLSVILLSVIMLSVISVLLVWSSILMCVITVNVIC